MCYSLAFVTGRVLQKRRRCRCAMTEAAAPKGSTPPPTHPPSLPSRGIVHCMRFRCMPEQTPAASKSQPPAFCALSPVSTTGSTSRLLWMQFYGACFKDDALMLVSEFMEASLCLLGVPSPLCLCFHSLVFLRMFFVGNVCWLCEVWWGGGTSVVERRRLQAGCAGRASGRNCAWLLAWTDGPCTPSPRSLLQLLLAHWLACCMPGVSGAARLAARCFAPAGTAQRASQEMARASVLPYAPAGRPRLSLRRPHSRGPCWPSLLPAGVTWATLPSRRRMLLPAGWRPAQSAVSRPVGPDAVVQPGQGSHDGLGAGAALPARKQRDAPRRCV